MQQKHFVQRFESVRGIAALMVAVTHTLMVPFQSSGAQVEIANVLTVLCNGRAAVTLFFVLSGFVLGLAIRRAEGGFAIEFLRYAVRRIFRIYPAFLCLTLLIVAWLCYGTGVMPGIAVWLDRSIGHHPAMLNSGTLMTWPVVFKNLFLLDPSLNLVTWTLKVEIGCSLLLPLLHYAVRGMSCRGKTLMLLGLIVLACLGKWFLLLGLVRAEALFDDTILKYVFLFYLGYFLPEGGPRCFEKLKAHTSLNALVLLAALAMLLLPQSQEDLRLVQGVGAWLILGGILYGVQFRWFRTLDHPLAIFYGRISYSFYLWHDVVLIVISRFFIFSVEETNWGGNRLLFVFVLWVISTAVTTGLALASYSVIEQPFIRWSRNICSRFGGETLLRKNPLAFVRPPPSNEVTTVT